MVGPPIYLVSGCASSEEFVAAFRRYADKGGIFVPMAEPIPANRRGRFALALVDGSVMVEGEAEVVASSRSVSPLYGRVGMTIRFVEPDEPSRTVLDELDRARLVTRVTGTSVAPRPADVPPEPRPVPPSASGRIDAANALAETVAIGDLAALQDLGPPKLGPRFVIPTIPQAPSGRTKSPSAFPIADARTPAGPGERNRPPTTPPRARSASSPPTTRDTQPVAVVPPPSNERRADRSASLPPLEDLKVGTTQAVAVVPPPQWASKNLFESTDDAGDTDRARPLSTLPTPTSQRAVDAPSDEIDATLDAPIEPPPVVALDALVRAAQMPRRGDPTPTLRGFAPIHDVDERTDLSTFPAPLDLRTTVVGHAPVHDTEIIAAQTPPTIEEPTPSGNWTMTPDGNISVLPSAPAPAPAKPAVDDGDWTITPDQDAPPSAWVTTPPTPAAALPTTSAATPPKGLPRAKPAAVKKETRVIEAVRSDEREVRAEPKIQIDPELVPIIHPTPLPSTVPPPSSYPQMPQTQMPMAMAARAAVGTPMHAAMLSPTAPPMQMPMAFVPPSATGSTRRQEDLATLNVRDDTSMVHTGGRRRMIVIVASSLVVVAIGIVVLVVALGGKRTSDAGGGSAGSGGAPAKPDPMVAATVVVDAAVVVASDAAESAGPAIATTDGSGSGSGSAEEVEPPPSIAGDCAVDVTSTPNGAEIYDAKGFRLGTAPQKIAVPCERTKLVLRKATYADTVRVVVPTKAGVKLKVGMPHAPLMVKVSSVPTGASVTVNGRPLGVTPTTIALPMLETSTLVFGKEGFASASAQVTPRQPNQAVQVQLKRRGRR